MTKIIFWFLVVMSKGFWLFGALFAVSCLARWVGANIHVN